jgi:hypothetical protein
MCVKSVLIGLSAVNEHVIFDTFVIKNSFGSWPEAKNYLYCRTVSLPE